MINTPAIVLQTFICRNTMSTLNLQDDGTGVTKIASAIEILIALLLS